MVYSDQENAQLYRSKAENALWQRELKQLPFYECLYIHNRFSMHESVMHNTNSPVKYDHDDLISVKKSDSYDKQLYIWIWIVCDSVWFRSFAYS